MYRFQYPKSLQEPLLCTICGREIALGEEYWACNGSLVCVVCLPELARQELAPCHETHGKEHLT